MFCKQVFCETKQNSRESICAGVSFKYSMRAPACSFIKKQTPTQVFSCHDFTHVQVQWSSKVSYDLLIKTCERKLLQDHGDIILNRNNTHRSQRAGGIIRNSYFEISNITACRQKRFLIGSLANNRCPIMFHCAKICVSYWLSHNNQ